MTLHPLARNGNVPVRCVVNEPTTFDQISKVHKHDRRVSGD